MDAEEIEGEFRARASKWADCPGMKKLLEVAVRKHGVTNSYDFDVLLATFMAHNMLPNIDMVEADYEHAEEELTDKNGYLDGPPSKADIMNKMISNYFGNVDAAAKTVVARLFGELDGDLEVDEYVRFRVKECYNLHQATFRLLQRKDEAA